jgi:hypothetical protein
MRVAAHVILPVPVEETWRRLLAWEDQPRWMKDADSVRVLTARREGVGVRVAVRTRVFDIPLFTEQLEVILWDPPRRLVMAHRSLIRGSGEWVLVAVERGTRLEWTEDVSLPVPALGELALRAYRPFLRRVMRRSLEGLQELLAARST